VCGGSITGRQHRRRQGEHRVAAVLQPRGACVVGLAVQVDPPTPVGPAGRADGHGTAQVDQATPLLHVQLDEGPDPAQRLLVRADVFGGVAASGHRLGHRDAIRVAKTSSLVGVEPARDQTGSGTRDTESRALLVDEARDGDGT